MDTIVSQFKLKKIIKYEASSPVDSPLYLKLKSKVLISNQGYDDRAFSIESGLRGQQLELKMNNFFRFLKDESGATAIEYGLIAAGVAVAISTAVTTLGTDLKSVFGKISGALVPG